MTKTKSEVIARWIDGNGRERSAEVVNPGSWEPHLFLLRVADCFDPPMFIVESDHPGERGWHAAYEEFRDSDQGERIIRIEEPDISDYDPDEIYYNGHGAPIDDDQLMCDAMSGIEGITYHGADTPPLGIGADQYRAWLDGMENGEIDARGHKGRWRYSLSFDPRTNAPDNPRARVAFRAGYAMAFASTDPTHGQPIVNPRDERAAAMYLRLIGHAV